MTNLVCGQNSRRQITLKSSSTFLEAINQKIFKSQIEILLTGLEHMTHGNSETNKKALQDKSWRTIQKIFID